MHTGRIGLRCRPSKVLPIDIRTTQPFLPSHIRGYQSEYFQGLGVGNTTDRETRSMQCNPYCCTVSALCMLRDSCTIRHLRVRLHHAHDYAWTMFTACLAMESLACIQAYTELVQPVEHRPSGTAVNSNVNRSWPPSEATGCSEQSIDSNCGLSRSEVESHYTSCKPSSAPPASQAVWLCRFQTAEGIYHNHELQLIMLMSMYIHALQ